MQAGAVVFDDWEAALKADVAGEHYRTYREAIVKLRYWLRPAPTGLTAPT